MYQDILILLAPSLLLFVLLILRRARGKAPVDLARQPPPNAIVVDGSNVMHWGGDPSADVLARVLRSIETKGHTPIVFFDASVGYKLGDRYYNETKLESLTGIPAKHICVVDKGVVADEGILAFASDHGLRIVTNDQFRDWRVQFPHAAKKGTLVGGQWRDGAVKWRGTL
jgi:hypothetical protein